MGPSVRETAARRLLELSPCQVREVLIFMAGMEAQRAIPGTAGENARRQVAGPLREETQTTAKNS